MNKFHAVEMWSSQGDSTMTPAGTSIQCLFKTMQSSIGRCYLFRTMLLGDAICSKQCKAVLGDLDPTTSSYAPLRMMVSLFLCLR